MIQKTSKIKLKVNTVEQYESAVALMCFLDDLKLKTAWKARSAVIRREGEYWERCDQCNEPEGEHDERCYDESGRKYHTYNEDYYDDR